MNKFNVVNAWSVPFINVQMNEPAELNEQLRTLFLDIEAQGDKHANLEHLVLRNEALFESSFSLFDWDHPAIAKLKDFCFGALYHAVGELNGFDVETLRKLHVAYESWFHVTRKGGFFGVHNHPLHSWSGVYCVCQEGDEEDERSGRLSFVSPFAMNTMYVDMSTHKLKPPFNTGGWPIRLSPGQLLLFPSWLLHEVTPFLPKTADGLRITVAFNARFSMEGVEPPNANMPDLS